MKILIPSAATITGDKAKVSSHSLQLSEVTQGRHVGLIPIQMSGSNKVFERLYRIEVAGEASDNGKGYRRVMLKATIPYHRIWTADPAAAINMREKQESASAGSISMHIVLSIPNRVRQDLVESSDPAATAGAEGHLAVVGALLSALTDQIRKPALIKTINTVTGEMETPTPAMVIVDEEGKADVTVDDPYNRMDTTSQPPLSVDPYSSERFGTTGLDVSLSGGHPYLSQNPRDPLVRGLFGLVPFEENTTVVAGPSILAIRASV